MGERTTGIILAAQIIASEAGITAEGTLEDRLRSAMTKGKDQWMITDDDERFRASVGAVLISATEDERQRLTEELRALQSFGALVNGMPIDITRIEVPENPVGLLNLWREVKAA